MLLNLLVKPVWLLVENQVQDQVGHAGFGTYMALFSFASILGVCVDLGLGQFTTKHLASPDTAPASLLPVVFPLKWGLTLLFPGLLVLAGWGLGYRGQELYWLLVIAAGYAFSQFLAFLRAILQGRQHFRADAWASVSERLLQLLLVVGLFWSGLTLETFIYSRTLAIGLAFAGGLLVLRRLLGPLRYQADWRHMGQVLRGSFPFALIMLLYGLNEKVDMVMLERLSSKAETGLYTAAYRWADAVMMYLWLVLPIFFARFAATTAEPRAQQQLLRVGQVLVSMPVVFVGVFVFFYGPVLFWQFDHSTAAERQRMQANLVLLFVHVAVQGVFALYSTLLTASDQEKPVSRLVALSVVLNVMLNSWLIPRYGSLGAAATTLFGSCLVSAGYLVLVKQKTGLALPGDILLKLAAAAGLLAVIFRLGQLGQLPWYWTTAIAGLAYTAILAALRVVTRKDLELLKPPAGMPAAAGPAAAAAATK